MVSYICGDEDTEAAPVEYIEQMAMATMKLTSLQFNSPLLTSKIWETLRSARIRGYYIYVEILRQ